MPRPLLGRPNADFSLSGLKTATRLAAQAIAPLRPRDVADLCASFQAAIVDVIEDRLRVGLRLFRERVGAAQAVVVAGGVASNGAIREGMARFCAQAGLPLVAPPPKLCTDNGAMIAWAGLERLRLGLTDDFAVAGATALAARPEGRAGAQQQGLRRTYFGVAVGAGVGWACSSFCFSAFTVAMWWPTMQPPIAPAMAWWPA